MLKGVLQLSVLLASFLTFSQAGHVMQGIGASNMSMGGAATAQPIDISGTLHWNPAGISVFDQNSLSVSAGTFFSSPTLYSMVSDPGSGLVFNGSTEDDRGVSIMPAIAAVFGNEESRHTFGLSAFGIAGFGVTFPEESNNPGSSSFNPLNEANPINFPQQFGGFGRIESDYMLLQIGISYAYEISDHLSIGIQPTINYSALEIQPNPLAVPNQVLGYPVADKASAIGFGGQLGIFYHSNGGLKLGASYKTTQYFGDFDFDQSYIDGSKASNVKFKLNYPSILSLGFGYSWSDVDFALDFRHIDYDNTDGFEKKGWNIASNGFPDGSVKGFGWKDVNVLSVGLQYKGISHLPLRIGYTYSSNPINNDLTMFNTPATAIIKDAVQFGLGYEVSDRVTMNLTYHHGFRGDKTKGKLLNPMLISSNNPLGKVPGSEVSYNMSTDLVMITLDYTFGK